MEDPIFQMGTVRLLGNTEVAKVLHQAVFRDKNPICGTQGIQNGYPGDRGLVIASLGLYPLYRGTEPVDPSGPQSPSVPQKVLVLRPGLQGGKVSLILPPSAIIGPLWPL